MRKNALVAFFFFSAIIHLAAQIDTVVIVQPGPNEGQDVPLFEHSPNGNPNQSIEFISYHWNFSNGISTGISLIKFEMPAVSPLYEIKSASLSLYHNPKSGSAGQKGDNACYLKKVTSKWEEDKVTWNTQPTTTSSGQKYLATSTSSTQDYLNLDVTDFVKDWISEPSKNYGMMLEIINRTSSNQSMKFCSSNYSDNSKRPKLQIAYTRKINADTCLTLQPGPIAGKDVLLTEHNPDNSLYKTQEFISYNWTFSSTISRGYSVIQFDLPQMASKYQLVGAHLSLYHNPVSSSAGHSGKNACYLKKVTSSWTETTATWNNMPSTTDNGSIVLSTSGSQTQDYTGINITKLASDWYNDPLTNHGMMLEVIDQSNNLSSMKFCSSDYVDSTLRPKLELCFALVNQTSEATPHALFQLYPNPSNGSFNLILNAPNEVSKAAIKVFDSQGRLTHDKSYSTKGDTTVVVQLSESGPGIYFIQIAIGDTIETKSIVVE